MKSLLCCLLFLPFQNQAQKIALLDRSFMNPPTLTDSILQNQPFKGQFPIFFADLDMVIKTTKWFIKYLDTATSVRREMKTIKAGHSDFILTTEKTSNTNTYCIFFKTKTGTMELSMELVNSGDSRRRALQKMSIFNDYLQNNKVVLEEAGNDF